MMKETILNVHHMEALVIFGRILFGSFFLTNGLMHFAKFGRYRWYASSKGVPMPGLAVVCTGLLLIAGGLGFVSGMYLDYASYALIVFLLLVTFMMHRFWKEADMMKKQVEMTNFTKNMALLGAILMML